MIAENVKIVAPDFSISDSEGLPVKLANFRNKKNVVLVFNRGFS
jgi:peroxiredoxin